ncbi:hypothetical protein ACXIZN_41010 [Amycolatopsis sp. TRM77291]
MNRFTNMWSTLTDSLRRTGNTVALAFHLPRDGWRRTYRWYRRQWPAWAHASENTQDDATKINRSLYNRAVGLGALQAWRENQTDARIKLGVMVIGLVAGGSGWIWLAAAAQASGITFAAVSMVMFVLNALIVAPAAAHTANPWRRLSQLAVVWAAISIVLLGCAQWPPLASWSQRPPSTLQVLSFATGTVAVFCLVGALLARIAFFVVDLTIARRRVRELPEVTALMAAIDVFAQADKGLGIGDVWRRRWMIRKLDLIGQCVERGIPSLLAMPDSSARDVARDRFQQAASVIRGYQTWIALPKPETGEELRSRLAELAMTLLTGHYDRLPTNADTTGSTPGSTSRKIARHVSGVMVAALPLAVVLGWSAFGPVLPEYLKQWLTGFAIVWFIARFLQLLDPASRKTWEQVHTVLGSPQSPSSKS